MVHWEDTSADSSTAGWVYVNETSASNWVTTEAQVVEYELVDTEGYTSDDAWLIAATEYVDPEKDISQYLLKMKSIDQSRPNKYKAPLVRRDTQGKPGRW